MRSRLLLAIEIASFGRGGGGNRSISWEQKRLLDQQHEQRSPGLLTSCSRTLEYLVTFLRADVGRALETANSVQ